MLREKNERELINEFTNMHKIMFGAFPHLFLLGGKLPTQGPLSKDFVDFFNVLL